MSPDSSILPDVHKIAVLRANALGDYVFSLPALEAIRAAYPDAEIVLLGREWHQSLLEGRPGPVNRVTVVPKSRGINGPPGQEEQTEGDPQELDCFFDRQREEKYDLALQIHGGGRNSNPFTLRLGARLTAGLRAPDALPLDRWVPYRYFQPEILRILEVASLIGANPVTLEPHFVVTPRDREEAERVVPDPGRPLVVIHPGAGDPARRWPAHRFGMIANRLVEAGVCVVVTGMPPEVDIIQGVLSGSDAPLQDVCGQLSIGGLAGLLSRAALVIANDSGPLHLAEAVGTPTVGIYWCGNLITAGSLTCSRHRTVLSWQLECSVCGRNTIYDPCLHRESFVAGIPAEDVLAEAFDLLSQSPGSKPS